MKKLKRKVNFDVCTICNHKCSFCSNPDPRTQKGQTSYVDFLTVMDNMTQYIEIYEMGLSAKGEVTINKDLSQIIQACKQRYQIPYVYFSTNGAKLDQRRMLNYLEAGLDSIKFSINAVDAQGYLAVHKADDFEAVIENLKQILILKNQHFPQLKVLISSVINLEKSKLEQVFQQLLGKHYELINGVSVYKITYTPKFDVINQNREITKKCGVPFNEIYINSDGSLGLCCKDYFDEVNFGSLLNQDFMQLYEGDVFSELRQQHFKSQFSDNHLCKNCLLYGEQP